MAIAAMPSRQVRQHMPLEAQQIAISFLEKVPKVSSGRRTIAELSPKDVGENFPTEAKQRSKQREKEEKERAGDAYVKKPKKQKPPKVVYVTDSDEEDPAPSMYPQNWINFV